VALVRIGWFATGGHTEVGGLQRFLERIDDGPRWVRCFPAVQKPGPKLGRAAPAPSDEGITGADLGARMLKLIRERHQPGEFDAYLLVDDADCRFCGDDPTAARAAFTERLALEVAQHLGRDVPVVAN
jgi:hypothetical protein